MKRKYCTNCEGGGELLNIRFSLESRTLGPKAHSMRVCRSLLERRP